jgi:hypothetical protein
VRQITKLAHPFPQRVIHGNPSGGGTYVKHSVVEQRILTVLGPVDFELVQIIRGDLTGKAPDPKGSSARAKAGTPDLVGVVVGVVARMRATIDGRLVTVEEAGDCESPANWPHDGARMKDAMSDAYKRAGMRIGVGLHLWAQDEFDLFERLEHQDIEATKARLTSATKP